MVRQSRRIHLGVYASYGYSSIASRLALIAPLVRYGIDCESAPSWFPASPALFGEMRPGSTVFLCSRPMSGLAKERSNPALTATVMQFAFSASEPLAAC